MRGVRPRPGPYGWPNGQEPPRSWKWHKLHDRPDDPPEPPPLPFPGQPRSELMARCVVPSPPPLPEDVAKPDGPSPGALRQRKHRRREAEGLAVVGIEVDTNAVAEAAIASGTLSEQESANPARIKATLEGVIRAWAAGWRVTRDS